MFNTEIHVSRCLQQGARTNRTITTAHRISCWVSSVPESDEHTLTAHLLGPLVWCSIVIPHLLQGPISEHRPFAHDVMTPGSLPYRPRQRRTSSQRTLTPLVTLHAVPEPRTEVTRIPRLKQDTGAGRESVLFIGTQFSILYTSMYSPA